MNWLFPSDQEEGKGCGNAKPSCSKSSKDTEKNTGGSQKIPQTSNDASNQYQNLNDNPRKLQ